MADIATDRYKLNGKISFDITCAGLASLAPYN